MNKLFIGLLIIAAGTGIFFLVRKTKKSQFDSHLDKELIIGKWKDVAKDSMGYFVFKKDGQVIYFPPDASETDTSFYTWKNNSIIWKDKITDSSGEELIVQKLVADSLEFRGLDSSRTTLVKVND